MPRLLTTAEGMAARKAEEEGMVTQKVKVGKLYLVDLAGSERLKKSRCGHARVPSQVHNTQCTPWASCSPGYVWLSPPISTRAQLYRIH